MTTKIRATLPDPPLSGASLMRESVAGRKTRFVLDTSTASVSFTIASGSSAGVDFSLSAFPPDIPTSQRNSANIVSWNDCVAWAYEDIYVDTNNDSGFLLPNGSSTSSGQRLIIMSKYSTRTVDAYSGSIGFSSTTRYRFFNQDVSSHTLYFNGHHKVIIYGEALI